MFKIKNKKLKFIVHFSSILLLLGGIWYLFFNIIRDIPFFDYLYEEGIFLFSEIQLNLSKILLTILNYNVEIYGKTIKIIGNYGIRLDRGCLGRNTLGLFIGFILAFPGKSLSKLWFIPIGTIIFIFTNVLRITALTIIEACCPEKLEFNHHFTFKIIIFFIIFLLWIWWIQKYSIFAKETKST